MSTSTDLRDRLLNQLADPNTASKRWIVRQYDHEVQGNTIIKPLVGANGDGPGDAAVIQPVPGSNKGLAIGCGLNITLDDPYERALASLDECIRNLVCVGADPDRIAILDNFCWPSCQKPQNLGALVRAAEGCYDGAKAYRTPFVSGKDSLNNQFRTKDGEVIEIPHTLLITGIGIVDDVSKCITMDAKRAGNVIVAFGADTEAIIREFRYNQEYEYYAKRVAALISEGHILSAHDCSMGGPLVALAEMLLAGSTNIGAKVRESCVLNFEDVAIKHGPCEDDHSIGYLLEIEPKTFKMLRNQGRVVEDQVIAELTADAHIWFDLRERTENTRIAVTDCRAAFYGTLDW